MAVKKSGLGPKGKGLEALFESTKKEVLNKPENTDGSVVLIDINKVEPNRNQPRKHFQEEALEELSESIKNYGVIQPVVVKKNDGYFELIAGERRWRASKIAGLKEIPAIIKEYDENKIFEIALAENLQREDLNPMEEAAGYNKLSQEFGLSQDDIAKRVGKSRSAVANSMRLLNLDSRVQELVKNGKLSPGHARSILPVENAEEQFELAEKIIDEELSVRETESLVKRLLERKMKAQPSDSSKFNTDGYNRLEENLRNILGTKVKLKSGKNKGAIEIEYYSDEDLDRIMGLINKIII
ncbi:ParB/RepB/Spo0J family partition protein [Lachnospiraceae bacterium NSJ-143]|nr:ParB/RepB/Spo0J family partition protein [Lachnospiraceae bacterium NSJ-143]